MIIMLDPGHGGRQPGAVGPTGLRESDVCLAVALRVRDLLRPVAHARGWDIRLMRTSDVDVSLAARRAPDGAACFVSIHCNAATNRSAHGTETFYQVSTLQHNGRLCNILQRLLIAQLRLRDRGVKSGNFQVLRQATCPAALVELAFISNPAEEALLRSSAGQERAAQALAAGIAEFLQPTIR